jgi:hypothetical protein
MDSDIDYSSRIPTQTVRKNRNNFSKYRNNNYRYSEPKRYEEEDEYTYGNPMTIFWIVGIIVVIVVIIIAMIVLFRPRPGSNWPQINTTKGVIGCNCQNNSECMAGLVCFQGKCATNSAVQTELTRRANIQKPLPQKIQPEVPLSTDVPVYNPITKPRFDIPTGGELPIVVPSSQISAVATAGFSG